METQKHLEDGSKRIKYSDLKLYIYNKNKWIKLGDLKDSTKEVIDIYFKNGSEHILVDELTKDFFKGYLLPDDKISGQRIKYTPKGKALARGGFSIFAKNLRINETKDFEWDICYENSSGLKTYLYAEDKIHLEQEKKAKIVDKFIEFYPTIIKKLIDDLNKKKEIEYIALYTLINTHIRVGNLEYYNHLKHKGLTTLQKKDIKISNNNVTFEFIGKDGVPQKIEKPFEDFYIKILKQLLNSKKEEDFVFTDKKGIPLHSCVFSNILFKYTKEHFYPHIIRSYFADTNCIDFLKNHKTATKKEVEEKFLEIAKGLGHKKYNKKKDNWEICSKVTIANYIRPSLSSEMIRLYDN